MAAAFQANAFQASAFQTGAALQFARPISDISTGGWVNEAGSSTNIYASLDETTPSATDYAISPTLTSGGSSYSFEALFASLTDPSTSGSHTIRYQYLRQGQNQVDIVVRVLQGTTEIASWTHTNVPLTATNASQTLTGPQADSVTNYGDLRVRFTASSP